MKRIILLLCAFIAVSSVSVAKKKPTVFDGETYYERAKDIRVTIDADKVIKLYENISKHSALDLTEVDGQPIEDYIRSIDFRTDSLYPNELVQELRKVNDYFYYNFDNHFVTIPSIFDTIKYKNGVYFSIPPFSLLNVNDTLIIDKSYSPDFRQGDLVESINGVSAHDLIGTYYENIINVNMTTLLALNDFSLFRSEYNIKLKRDGKELDLTVDGVSSKDLKDTGKYFSSKTYSKEGVGYFKIREFVYNKYIYKHFNKYCKQLKTEGINNLVIDLRFNSGGSGHMIDAFAACVSDKDSIAIRNGKSTMYRASELTAKYYKPDEADYGKLLPVPQNDDYQLLNVPLKDKYFVDNFNVYILINRSTASAAVGFANYFQYNGIAKLVGEGIPASALCYGDMVPLYILSSMVGVSTVKYSPLTLSDDNAIYPDIEIPFVIKEYQQGGDPILEKLIDKLAN